MKLSRILVVLTLLACGLVVNRALYAAQAEAEKIPPQRFDAKVLQVFAAKDGEAVFRAYLVKWKDQDVIASDSLASTDFHVGDTITVLAMNHPFPQNREPRRLLAFMVVPRGR